MLVLALGVFLVLGTVVSAVQAGEMGVKMIHTSDTGVAGQDGCSGCGGGGNADTNMDSCQAGCVAVSLALPPSVFAVATGDAPPVYMAVPSSSDGRVASPEPLPPRSFEID